MTSNTASPPVGSVVWQRIDPEAAHQPVGGHVVDAYVDDDGAPGVVVVSFRKAAGKVQVETRRIPLGDIADEGTKPPGRYTVAPAYRHLFAALGQRQTPAGPPLEDHELRWYAWAEALRRAGEIGATS